jgi:hypothetical protein
MTFGSIAAIDVNAINVSNFKEAAGFLEKNFCNFNRKEQKKAVLVASKIRNMNLLASLETGTAILLPSQRKVHLWNIALQTPFFDRMWRSDFKEKSTALKEKIETLIEYDQDCVNWIWDYLENSDACRKQSLLALPFEMLMPLLFLADYLNLTQLKQALEIKIVKTAPHSKAFLEDFNKVECFIFPLIHKFLFLVNWLAETAPSLEDKQAQHKAKGILLSCLGNPPKLTLGKKHIPFLQSQDSRIPHLEFTLEPNCETTDTEWKDLLKIARQYRSKTLLSELLEVKLKQLGYGYEKPYGKKAYIDNFHEDNYFPKAVKIPEPNTARYQGQKRFFQSPYPAKDLEGVVFLKSSDPQALALLQEFPEIGIGISASPTTLLQLDLPLKPMSNVHLLAIEGELQNEEAFLKKLASCLDSLPKLKYMVISPDSSKILTSLNFIKKLTHQRENKITIWRNLTGNVVRGKAAIKNEFDFEWVKKDSTYSTWPPTKLEAVIAETLHFKIIRNSFAQS